MRQRATGHDDLPCFEPLEQRRLLSASLSNSGTLDIRGSSDDDIVIVQQGDNAGEVILFGVPGVDDGEVFGNVRKLRIQLLAGDDLGRIDGAPLTPEAEFMEIIMSGQGGDDQLEIVSANGRLAGGTGNDILFGGPGENKLVGNSGNDILAGGGGDDKLIGGKGNDRLFGEAGADTLRGGRGNDLLRGGLGDDTLFGGKNADDLFGGAGNDSLNGSSGSDLFRGHFGEWEDFASGDEFFSDEFLVDPESTTLIDEFWDAMDDLDTSLGFGLDDSVWEVVTGVQQIAGQTSAELDAFDFAAQDLTGNEQTELGDDIINTILEFVLDFSDPDSIDDDDLEDLLDEVERISPLEVRDEVEAINEAILADTQTRIRARLALRALGNEDIPDNFFVALRLLLPGG